MATFGLVRIDDRLIHGQVVALWVKQLQANRIVVVDDATATDSFMRIVLRGAAPPGTPVEVCTVEQAPATLMHPSADPSRTIVLMKGPRVALALKAAGVPIETLQVGGMGARPGRKQLYKNISASEEELAIFRQLLQQGVSVEVQISPNICPTPMASVLPK